MNPRTLLVDTCNWDNSGNRWTRFTQGTFAWLTGSPTASLVIKGLLGVGLLLLLGLLLRAALLQLRGRRTGRPLWLWGFPLALFLSISPLLVGEPLLTMFVPTYQDQTADAVVVLGRGEWLERSRVRATAELIEADRAPLAFISGRRDAPRMVSMLLQRGIAPGQLAGENCSKTTEENAEYTAQQLLGTGVRSIILVSDPAHLLRSQLVFSSFGFDVIPYGSPLPASTSLRQRRLLALRESVGFVTYGLMGRYWPRPIGAVVSTTAQ